MNLTPSPHPLWTLNEPTPCPGGLLTPAGPEAIQAFTEIYTENARVLRRLYAEADPRHLARALAHREDLPPGGHPDRVHLYTLHATPTGGPAVGLLELYDGHPGPRSLYIGSLFLKRDAQGEGRGRAVVALVAELARQRGYHELRCGVGLKNWPALRFWHRLGFDQLAKISGDAMEGPDCFALMELVRPL